MENFKDKVDRLVGEYIVELEEENKNLKERVSELEDVSEDYDLLSKDFITLGEENKKLKSDLAFERTMLDNVKAEYKSLQNVIKKLKEDVDYFRQCYLDLKRLCEKEGFMLSDEEVTKMFNLDEIK